MNSRSSENGDFCIIVLLKTEPFSGFPNFLHFAINFSGGSRGSENGDFCTKVNRKRCHFPVFLCFLPFLDEFPGEFERFRVS